MDKRGTTLTQPVSRADETKKGPTTAPRVPTSRTVTTPTSTRTSASSTRPAATASSKPPTRPPTSTARRPAARSSEGGEENRKPPRSALGATSSRASKPDAGSTDRTRRTTLGGPTASPSSRRPLSTPPHTSTPPSTSKTRPSTRSARGVVSPTAQSRSSGTASRPVSRDTIFEEPAGELPPGFVYAAEPLPPARSPPKLEIRSHAPRLKPRAESDAEVETRKPKPAADHVRAQSTSVGRAQGVQERQALQSLLRDSAARDAMSAEIQHLKAEVGRLEEENKTLGDTVAGATVPTVHASADEVETLKASHTAAMTALESTHTAELEAIRAEINQHRSHSANLEGVESKIRAVEEALRESRVRASRNEQELQETIQKKDEDRDQLAEVVKELQIEIEKCQKQLDADVAKQAREKQKAIDARGKLETELQEERRLHQQADQALQKEMQDVRDQMRERAEHAEQERDALHQQVASTARLVKETQDELEAARRAHIDESERHQTLLEASSSTAQGLSNELDKLKDDHKTEQERAQKQIQDHLEISNGLQSELELLKQGREREFQSSAEATQGLKEVIQDLQSQVGKLQQDGSDGTRVVEDLQAQLQELQQLKADMTNKHEEEMQQLRNVIESLQDDSGKLQRTHYDALAQKDSDTEALQSVVEGLQNKSAALQQQLEDARISKSDIVTRLSETIQSLHEETSAHKARFEEEASAKDRENSDLNRVVEELQIETQQRRKAAEDAESQAKMESEQTMRALEGLQDEVQTLQQKLHDKASEYSRAIDESNSWQQMHHFLEGQLESLTTEHDMLSTQSTSQRKSIQEREDRIEELQGLLTTAETGKNSAHASLAGVQEEMKGLQMVLETFQQDAAEKERQHSKAISDLRVGMETAHEGNVEKLRNDHAIALGDLRSSLMSEIDTSTEELQHKFERLSEEKSKVEKRLGDAEMRHNRELEEETQKHDAAYRALHDSFSQVKQNQGKHGNAQIKKLEMQYQALQDSVEEMKQSHQDAMGELSAGHERKVKEVMDQHARAIGEVEEQAARRAEAAGIARDRVHEAKLAALEAEHASALTKAVASPPPSSGTEGKVSSVSSTPASPPRGLWHVFVNHARNPSGNSENVHKLSDMPLAHAEIDDGVPALAIKSQSVDGAGPHEVGGGEESVEALKKEITTLQAALESTESELSALKDSKISTDEVGWRKGAVNGEVSSPLVKAEAELEDPFAPQPQSRTQETSVHASEGRELASNNMTLEGTLESLRIQTAHLLEAHDDILAENQRWSRRLGIRSTRDSPVKPAATVAS